MVSKKRPKFTLLGSLRIAAILGAMFSGAARAEDAPLPEAGASQKPANAPRAERPKEKSAKSNKSEPAVTTSAPELTADEIIEKANAFLDGARVLTADFVQVGPNGDRTEGELYVMRPGRLLFRYHAPSKLEIVADGRSVAIRDQKLGTQDLYFIQQTPLKFLLADRIDLKRDVTIKRVNIDENAASIETEDKQTFGGKSDITLIFDPQTFALKQWTVIDPQGFQTVVTLFDVDLISKPDPSQFFIDPNAAANSGPPKR